MKSFLKNYLVVLTVLIVAFAAYRATFVRSLEPKNRPTAPIPQPNQIARTGQWWEGFFSAGSWQKDNPTIVENSRGVLLAKTWEQVSPKIWRLQPLTIIMRQGAQDPLQTSPDDIWLVNAEDGAVIHFEEPFDLKSGGLPSIERGQLDGKIQITRISSKLPAEENWLLTTSDVAIERRRISTQKPVSILWNSSVIRGHDLRIMLRNDVLAGSSSENGPWGPLDELELFHLDELNIALPDGGLWSKKSQVGQNGVNSNSANLPARLLASCGGRFQFDFKNSLATLTNGVHIQQKIGSEPPDEFLCHKVSVVVEPAAVGAATSKSSFNGVQVKEITALGIDSLESFVNERWVELRSPSMNAAARAKQLKINLVTQRIELAGKLDQPGATNSIAWLQYQGYELSGPAIEYQAAPESSAGEPLHAGWLYAAGPGEFTSTGNSSAGESQIRWQDWLKFAPSDQPGMHWIELDGSTLVESKKHGFLTADRLKVWLKKNLTANLQTAATQNQSLANSTSAGNGLSSDWEPNRVEATGNATLDTPQLRAEVGTIDLTIVYPQSAQPQATEPASLILNDSVGEPVPQFVGPPQLNHAAQPSGLMQSDGLASPILSNPQLPPAGALPMANQRVEGADISAEPTADPKRQKVLVFGSSLEGNVVSSTSGQWIDALTVSGPLKIESDQKSVDPNAWKILGDTLHLATSPVGEVDLQIDGKPAKLLMADGELLGSTVRYDQRNNLIWMDQPGEFTLPRQIVNQGSTTSNWVKPPHCRWNGRMQFDGSVARIEGDIEFDGVLKEPEQLWMIQGFCQSMEFFLESPIDLRNPNSNTDLSNAGRSGDAVSQLHRITLKQNVDLRAAQTDWLGNRKSLERFVVPELTYYMADAKVVGKGPGWLSWKGHAGSRAGAFGPGQTVSSSSGSKQELQGAHMSFRDVIVGFTARREVIVEGKVEVLSGPISNWDQSIEKLATRRLDEQQLLNCDQLKIYDTSSLSVVSKVAPAGEAMWEVQATGNVVFEGANESGDYAGKGYQITYVRAKDMLYLRGDGRSPAFLQKIPKDTAAESTLRANVNQAAINVRTLFVEDLQLSQFAVEFPQAGAGTNAAPGSTSQMQLPTQAPNPRAGVTNFFQGR